VKNEYDIILVSGKELRLIGPSNLLDQIKQKTVAPEVNIKTAWIELHTPENEITTMIQLGEVAVIRKAAKVI
jgi:hypothetical protein